MAVQWAALGRVGEVPRGCIMRVWVRHGLRGGRGIEPCRRVTVGGEDGDPVRVVGGEVGVDEDEEVGDRGGEREGGREERPRGRVGVEDDGQEGRGLFLWRDMSLIPTALDRSRESLVGEMRLTVGGGFVKVIGSVDGVHGGRAVCVTDGPSGCECGRDGVRETWE